MAQVSQAQMTDAEIASIISTNNKDTSVAIYELLPHFIKDQDPEKVLRGFFEAVQSEYDRNKSAITNILTIVNPAQVNKNYILDGNLVFFHPEQFVYGAVAANPGSLTFSGDTANVAGSGFYRDFAVFVWSDETTPTAVGQYRKIIDYSGPTREATLDEDWEVVPSDNAVYALCWPDRIWLPVSIVSDPRKAGGTVFPSQNISQETIAELGITEEELKSAVMLPGLSYIATIDDYYVNWTLDFLDGANEGKTRTVTKYYASAKIVILDTPLDLPPDVGDWFRINPPSGNSIGVSDNYYRGMWVHVAAPKADDISYGHKVKVQTRQIIRSVFNPLSVPASHVAYLYDPRSRAGEQFVYPPAPTMTYGISQAYVPLQHLANYVGIDLDEEDLEMYQREQISQAYNFHRLRGTRRAMELVAATFGLDLTVDETASNYTHAPSPELVGPEATPDQAHHQYPNSAIVPLTRSGLGADDIPPSYRVLPGRDTARIPDSDIKLYLSRKNTESETFDASILTRILRKIKPHIPIHVQIIFVGLLTKIREKVEVEDSTAITAGLLLPDDVEVEEGFVGTPLGTVPITEDSGVENQEMLVVRSPARYSSGTVRYGRPGAFPASPRWTHGSLLRMK